MIPAAPCQKKSFLRSLLPCCFTTSESEEAADNAPREEISQKVEAVASKIPLGADNLSQIKRLIETHKILRDKVDSLSTELDKRLLDKIKIETQINEMREKINGIKLENNKMEVELEVLKSKKPNPSNLMELNEQIEEMSIDLNRGKAWLETHKKTLEEGEAILVNSNRYIDDLRNKREASKLDSLNELLKRREYLQNITAVFNNDKEQLLYKAELIIKEVRPRISIINRKTGLDDIEITNLNRKTSDERKKLLSILKSLRVKEGAEDEERSNQFLRELVEKLEPCFVSLDYYDSVSGQIYAELSASNRELIPYYNAELKASAPLPQSKVESSEHSDNLDNRRDSSVRSIATTKLNSKTDSSDSPEFSEKSSSPPNQASPDMVSAMSLEASRDQSPHAMPKDRIHFNLERNCHTFYELETFRNKRGGPLVKPRIKGSDRNHLLESNYLGAYKPKAHPVERIYHPPKSILKKQDRFYDPVF